MNTVCKMTGEATIWPCSAHGCSLYGDCLSEYAGNSKPISNADRIRAMTDEELARELALIAEWDRKQLQKAKSGPGLVEFMEHWLQQPAEEDT